MWMREAAVKPVENPTSGQSSTPATPPQAVPAPTLVGAAKPRQQSARDVVPIAQSLLIKGELSGSEDMTVEGFVDGTLELCQNVLTIGPNGRVTAQVFAKAVIVLGKVDGNITASEKVEIREGGSVHGDVVSPRVAIADGADFCGSVDMQTKGAQSVSVRIPQASYQRSEALGHQKNKPKAAMVAH